MRLLVFDTTSIRNVLCRVAKISKTSPTLNGRTVRNKVVADVAVVACQTRLKPVLHIHIQDQYLLT